MRSAYFIVMSIAVLAGLGASPARAQQGNDTAAAEQLFLQGRELMEQGKLDEACARFEASQKLDPALGTLLNLALCREKQGKVASAWVLYREVEAQARREGQEKRETTARERARALEAELPRLVIEVSEASQIPGLVVERDGTAVDATLFGVAVYVDPGVYRVVARAPGYRGFSAEIEIAKGKEKSVAIPVLEREAEAQDGSEQAGKPGGKRRIAGLGLGGAGVAAVAAGLGFGWSARSAWDDAFASGLCDRDALLCSPAGQDRTDSARSRALMSNILMGAGVALVAAGVVLYVTAPRRAERAGIAIIPMAGAGEIGAAVQGGF